MSYKRLTLRPGVEVNQRTARMIAEAERRLGKKFIVYQGSYNPGGVAASGDTHAGGGAVDLWLAGVAIADLNPVVVKTLRKVGFAAWYRPELWQNGKRIWGAHIHCIAIGDREMSAAAKGQVSQYRAGKNGLADHGADTGPRVAPWHTWKGVLLAKRAKAAQRDLEQWRRDHA